MSNRSNPSNKAGQSKFQDPIEMLNDSAKEKQRDLTAAVENEYREFKHSLNDALHGVNATGQSYTHGVRKRAEQALLSGEEQLKNVADKVETRVRENPLVYLTAGMAAAFVLGYSLCQSRHYAATTLPVKRDSSSS